MACAQRVSERVRCVRGVCGWPAALVSCVSWESGTSEECSVQCHCVLCASEPEWAILSQYT
eukprot:6644135-Prymnesium_polylepis.1